MNERNILVRMAHPFIVRCIAAFQDKKVCVLVLEFCAGGDLYTHIRRLGRFPNDGAKTIAAELILAIQYVHDWCIVYPKRLAVKCSILAVPVHLSVCFGIFFPPAPSAK